MNEPDVIERERDLVRDLRALTAEREAAEVERARTLVERRGTADAALQETRQRVVAEYETETATAETEFQAARAHIIESYEGENAALQAAFVEQRAALERAHEAAREAAEGERYDNRWAATAVFETARKKAKGLYAVNRRKLDKYLTSYKELSELSEQTLARWGHDFAGEPVTVSVPKAEPLKTLKKKLKAVQRLIWDLHDLWAPRVLQGPRYPLLAVVLWLLALAPALVMKSWLVWAGVSTGVVLAAAVGGWFALTRLAGRQIEDVKRPLRQALADADAAAKRCLETERQKYKKVVTKQRAACRAKLRAIQKQYRPALKAADGRHAQRLTELDENTRRQHEYLVQTRTEHLTRAEEIYHQRLAEASRRYESEVNDAVERHRAEAEASRQAHDDSSRWLSQRWHDGMADLCGRVARVNADCEGRSPPWAELLTAETLAPTTTTPAVRFGELSVAVEPGPVPVPAIIEFPARASLLYHVGDDGRAEAVRSMQAVMLRVLTALPPGKVRFVIIDPVGLGENFAAFMHLTDYEESLVASRIWTEQAHIDQRLADITAHMETVIQKYLRNQYPSITAYNEVAGEVAEPFRFLVIANFPANFTTEAARRLVSIVASGPGCGVSALMSIDTRQPLPDGFDLADLERGCVNLDWAEGGFRWRDEAFGSCPLTLDAPPSDAAFTRLLHTAGELAKNATRVEVNFDFIAPPADKVWGNDSRSGITVPLGRAGATRRQYLALGKGTAQHVLIAGKTGSGKSTLLHAMITNLALHYSPDELELYLIDFKKGVEFKTYATHAFPHARVIAIESEREFGLSVLQRLDAELRSRGDRYRSKGVNDLASYRGAGGDGGDNDKCPRILLIVDEFQEFFVEDDKLAQEAALLLDRLVRQGRAFGLHILLGSQTLGGAYTLARSTIDQMAVRIALQCSEADAYLILSKDNPAARLLSRPGEAIYNDTNGLIEGNELFQVVWLPDAQREKYLDRLHEMAHRDANPPPPPLVFEGNSPALLENNRPLGELIRDRHRPLPTTEAASAWLGEAIAIKDPTAAVFRRQSGANLLIVGQDEESALSITASAVVGLAVQHYLGVVRQTSPEARFFVLDGSPSDSSTAGALARVAGKLSLEATVANFRGLPGVVTEVAAEVARRQQDGVESGPAWYLVVYGLQRFRDLRKSEDDYGGFGRGDDPPSPAKQFVTILREGPALGVFVIVWCDSLNNLQRGFDRQTLREFEQRVLFQMSQNDSSTLIDAPTAGKLGMHRALLHCEDKSLPEKFRPYGRPPESWLDAVAASLRRPTPQPV